MAAQFSKRLRDIRLQLGLRQKDLAKVLGNTSIRVSEWERGHRTPKPLTQEGILMKLQKAVAAASRKKLARRKR